MRKPSNPRTAIAYLRVSTKDQHNGPDAQRADIKRWAEREGITVLAWFEERVSGGKGYTKEGALDLDQRPELGKALDALEFHHAGLLVVSKRDRLGRDVFLMQLLERFAVPNRGGRFVSAAGEGTNSDDPGAADYAVFSDMGGARERRDIRERTRKALAAKKDRGEALGSIPYGSRVVLGPMRWDRKRLETRPIKLLEPDVGEQCVICLAQAFRALEMSTRAVAEELNAHGFRSRVGKPFVRVQICRMLG